MAGMDDFFEKTDDEVKQEKVVEMPKRKAFHIWTVDGVDYKMKLKASVISALEDKFGGVNLMLIVSDLPSLKNMLQIAQAAIAPWHHGVKYADVERLFDKYVEEGGSQMDFYKDHIMGCMNVSGFFTENQSDAMQKALETSDLF